MLDKILVTFLSWKFWIKELQQIALNHSSDINSEVFIKIYKKCTAELYSFLVNDARLASDNPLRFRKNLLNI